MSEEEYYSDSSIASDYGLLKKALPFECVIPKNFDPNKVPQTAEEFLQYATYERSQMKPWVTAKIDPSKLTGSVKQIFIDKLDNSVDSIFLPSKEWQQKKLEDFIEFRDFIQPRIKRTSTNVLLNTNKEKDILKELITEKPNYNNLITYSQADKIKVLEVAIDHLDSLDPQTCFNFNTGSWIYAILSLLEVPLFSDDCHIVRLLAKKCITLRSSYKEIVEEKYYPLNLFICLISKFYGQLDLSDS